MAAWPPSPPLTAETDPATFVALATALRSVSSALRDTHVRRLKSQLGAPGSAGRSLDNALVESFNDAPPVFDPLAFRLRNAVEAGRDYTSLFEDFGGLYRIPSLVLVSIALRTSSRFGSSIRPVLTQVATSLRSQQELRREFMAATAETRFTAAAFALLPLGLAAYMILINENYSRVLLDTDTGHTMLAIAGGLQTLGVIIIWPLVMRSIHLMKIQWNG